MRVTGNYLDYRRSTRTPKLQTLGVPHETAIAEVALHKLLRDDFRNKSSKKDTISKVDYC